MDKTTQDLKNHIIKSLKTHQALPEIKKALFLAINLHSQETAREDGPYINHILRVTNYIVNYLNIKDKDIIIAAIFHDAVEDQSEKLSHKLKTPFTGDLQDQAKGFLKHEYGNRVAEIVDAVTNSKDYKLLKGEEKNKEYVSHIEHSIKNPQAFYVKLSDFIDNGIPLGNLTNQERKTKLAKKYLPLYRIFTNRLKESDIKISEDLKTDIIKKLIDAETGAKTIIQQENQKS